MHFSNLAKAQMITKANELFARFVMDITVLIGKNGLWQMKPRIGLERMMT
jgi:hypothetical protein